MSLYGMIRTGISGMNAQANRLSAVADNVTNAGTVGYKRAETRFTALVMPKSSSQYNSGTVMSNVHYGISQQGGIRSTDSETDLAVSGNGYFLVSNNEGQHYLTRAGAFVPDQSGDLVNTAGYFLQGYPITGDGNIDVVANGFDGLERVNVRPSGLVAEPTTTGKFSVNLPATDALAKGQYSHKTSLVAYDNLGQKFTLDIYFTKVADNKWTVEVKEAKSGMLVANAADLLFDEQTGQITGDAEITVTPSLASINVNNINLDLRGSTQLAKEYTIIEAVTNGRPPASITNVTVGLDGLVVGIYEDGSSQPLYRLALGTVASPDRMSNENGCAFLPSAESGSVRLGFPRSNGLGQITSGALEESNADIAQELADMIEGQRSYTANSKVFQTGSELMDVLINLKR